MSRPSPLAELPGVQRLLSEPRRPAVIRNAPKAPMLVVATVCIGAFMGQLDASILNMTRGAGHLAGPGAGRPGVHDGRPGR